MATQKLAGPKDPIHLRRCLYLARYGLSLLQLLETKMSNAVPTDDQTFLGKFRKDLENGGMFPDMAQAVIDSVVEGEKSSAMAGRWMDDPAGYPAMMYNVLWMLVKTYALTYIDKHAPQAWFRPVFLPVSEQTKSLEDCRKEHRDAAARQELIDNADGDCIAILNPDAYADNEHIKIMIENSGQGEEE